jgi:hypothetical protein
MDFSDCPLALYRRVEYVELTRVPPTGSGESIDWVTPLSHDPPCTAAELVAHVRANSIQKL